MIDNKIIQYLHSDSRNKIVFFKEKQVDIPCLNVGYHLALEINKMDVSNPLSFKIKNKLDTLLNNAVQKVEPFGSVLCIENLGILFEEELKLNFKLFLDNYSINTPLFIKWDGEMDNNTLYFLSREKGIEIDMNDISHITL